MPSSYTYPGVYVEEIPSGVRTIVGVSTSVTAFIGRTARGIVNEPKLITSFGDFERDFGGQDYDYPLSYAVNDFFVNGGSLAVIVRLTHALSDAEKTQLAAKPVLDDLLTKVKAATDVAGANSAIKTAIDGQNDDKIKAVLQKIQTDVAALPPEPAVTKDAIIKICQTAADEYKDAKDTSAKAASVTIGTDFKLQAVGAGIWGDNLRVILDTSTDEVVLTRFNIKKENAFNLTVEQYDGDEVIAKDVYSNVCVNDKNNSRYVGRVLKRESASVLLPTWNNLTVNPTAAYTASSTAAIAKFKTALEKAVDDATDKPKEAATKKLKALAGDSSDVEQQTIAQAVNLDAVKAGADKAAVKAGLDAALKKVAVPIPLSGGADGGGLEDLDYLGDEEKKEGLYALEDADFNLLCIPPDTFDGYTNNLVYVRAAAYCQKRRAMLIVDPRDDWGKSKSTAVANAKNGYNELVGELGGPAARYAMLYFPRIQQRDPLRNGDIKTVAACGVIAGVMARTDATRGVWKAPAGIDAALAGAVGVQVVLNDRENGVLNPLGVNCLRNFPVIGNVVWGARTLRGADILADDYKYVPIRRLANYIEESLYRGTKWIVFEPNDEPLWSQIRLNLGAFMQDLFRQGAFQGSTPNEAYFVRCDKDTTTQFDIDRGIVNINVGFAPLKPAEFVVLKI